MQTIFCPHCGSKHPYNLVKPKFCSSCGEGISSIASTAKTNRRVFEEDDENVDDQDFFSDSDSVPNLKKGLDLLVEVDTKYRTLDLGSIIDGKGEKILEPIKKDAQFVENSTHV